jgi:hypothetical protein
LCRGLRGDDWALEDSIDRFARIVAEHPSDLFAGLGLADALRERFPHSFEAEAALQGVRDLLDEVDVGAARARLLEYIDTNLSAVRASRSRAPGLLAKMAALLEGNGVETDQIGEFLLHLSRGGKASAGRAIELLDRLLPYDEADPAAIYIPGDD